MRETCKTPTTSLDGVPHDRTHGGTALLLQSTEFDRIRQNPTETRVRAYPKFARVRTRGEARFPPTRE